MKKLFSFFLVIVMAFSFPISVEAFKNEGMVLPDAAFSMEEESFIKLNQKSTAKTQTKGTFTFKISGKENYDYANTVLTELNKIRADKDLPKLKMDKKLMEVAMQRAAECAVFYDHIRPDNSDCFSLVEDEIYCVGENIAIGYETPKEVITAWKNSQGHYENMVRDVFNCVGIGCFETSNGILCWVQYFGKTTPEVVKKTGKVKATHKITAAAENLMLTVSVSEKISFNSTVNTSFDFIIKNYNVAFPYAVQKISESYFYYSSSNSKVIAIKDKKKGVIKGEGKSKITAKVKKNSKIKFTNTVYIDHVHSGKLKSKTEKISGCKKTVTKKYLCKKCGDTYTKKTTTSCHSPGKWKTVKKATVYASGEKQKKCTKCKKVVETAVIKQLKCSVPSLQEISNAQNGVKIEWGKVKGADQYRVYRKTKTSDWEYIKTTSKTYYTDKTAKSGTKYYYAVKARNEAGNSSLSGSLTKLFISPPILELPQAEENCINLLWSDVSAAQGYIIYRKTNTADYVELATVAEPCYSDINVESVVEYTYKVKAYYNKTSSAYSDEVTVSIDY